MNIPFYCIFTGKKYGFIANNLNLKSIVQKTKEQIETFRNLKRRKDIKENLSKFIFSFILLTLYKERIKLNEITIDKFHNFLYSNQIINKNNNEDQNDNNTLHLFKEELNYYFR